MSAQEAPETDIRVLTGKGGNVFIRFADGDDRRVELLNEDDARQLCELLGEVVNDE